MFRAFSVLGGEGEKGGETVIGFDNFSSLLKMHKLNVP